MKVTVISSVGVASINPFHALIETGLCLDRKATNRLFKVISEIESDDPGHRCMMAQLQAFLDRRDWITIHVSAPSEESLKKMGVKILIIEDKPKPVWKKKGLSPLQKMQNSTGIGRRHW